MMAMANHTQWMGGDTSVIHATGGAAGNRQVLQVMADVFGARVIRARSRNSAALGAALRAWHGHAAASGQSGRVDHVVEGSPKADPEWRFDPRADAVRIYAALRKTYADEEHRQLRATI
jgi:sugar (pentulose or hexulose) kinase